MKFIKLLLIFFIISNVSAQKLEYDLILKDNNKWEDAYLAITVLPNNKVNLQLDDYKIQLDITESGKDYLNDNSEFFYMILRDVDNSVMLIQFFKEDNKGVRIFFEDESNFQFVNNKKSLDYSKKIKNNKTY